MITLKNVINYALIKGLDYEIDAPQSWAQYARGKEVVHQHNSKTQYCFKIGVQFKHGIWVWFKAYAHETEELTMDIWTPFHERYSQLNGRSIKAWKTGNRYERKIMELTEKLF